MRRKAQGPTKEEKLATRAEALGYQFKGTEFDTADDKAKVIKQWRTFIREGFQEDHFTKRLYHHLTLHCAFIAHYNEHGFYTEYFVRPQDTIKFLSQFDSNNGRSVEYGFYGQSWTRGDYEDLNKAMMAEFDKVKVGVYGVLRNKAAYESEIVAQAAHHYARQWVSAQEAEQEA